MRPHIVADVGNSRVKWGLCSADGTQVVDQVSLAEAPTDWDVALEGWRSRAPLVDVKGPLVWVLASVRPERSERLRNWLTEQGHAALALQSPEQLPLAIDVVAPRRVGIDRLLNAVAARRRLASGEPAVLVDAGSAVTVDWLDEAHVFRGGAIFPGLRLMAESLHQYTAFLPLVTICEPIPELPARDTTPAIEAGIFHAVVGAIERMVHVLRHKSAQLPRVYLTGGDATLLAPTLVASVDAVLWPRQTLEGILITAEGLSL